MPIKFRCRHQGIEFDWELERSRPTLVWSQGNNSPPSITTIAETGLAAPKPPRVFVKCIKCDHLPSWALLDQWWSGAAPLIDTPAVFGLAIDDVKPTRLHAQPRRYYYVAYEFKDRAITLRDLMSGKSEAEFIAKLSFFMKPNFSRRLVLSCYDFMRSVNQSGFYFTDFTLDNVMGTLDGGQFHWIDLDSAFPLGTRIVHMLQRAQVNQGWYDVRISRAEGRHISNAFGPSLNAWFAMGLALFVQRMKGLGAVILDQQAPATKREEACTLAQKLWSESGLRIELDMLVASFQHDSTAIVRKKFGLSQSLSDDEILKLRGDWAANFSDALAGSPNWDLIGRWLESLAAFR
jgi:hypothetical protein